MRARYVLAVTTFRTKTLPVVIRVVATVDVDEIVEVLFEVTVRNEVVIDGNEVGIVHDKVGAGVAK